jgi:predicted CoA-binding protein
MNMPRVLILGASDSPERYSYKAMQLLIAKNFPVLLVGLKRKEVHGLRIDQVFPKLNPEDVITLYVGAQNQRPWYEMILNSGAAKVIFNPGTENTELQQLLDQKGMKWEEACTLVLLNTNQFP